MKRNAVLAYCVDIGTFVRQDFEDENLAKKY
ncbi:hypothetical protein HNP72_000767 [Sphingobacterium soli]|nr:hypothetical protein [Sphingobacterium soli]